MAPTRRKGRAAAAAAAAAAQQWKVGDLVLAKMKGFPPWPAAISEPQKWGYPSDRKKLFVYFFGTKQIAFCNHADVEAFTEEKKKILLVKRQGKGADFVRAVDEIVDSFEKLKEQKIDDEFITGAEAIEPKVGNMECSSVSSCIKGPVEPQSTSNCQPDATYPSMQGDSLDNSEEVPVTSTGDDAIQNKGVIHEQPNGKVSILDQLRRTPLATVGSLRKRSRDTSQKSDLEKKAPSLQRSRSSTNIDLSNIQKSEMQTEADSCGNDIVPDVSLEECSLNSKVSRKSPVIHEADPEVSTLVPKHSCEDLVSGTVAVQSGTNSITEGCTMELNCKAESRMENLDKGLVLSAGLDIQGKMVVLKKKRKPNKKRLDQEMAAHCKLEKESYVHVEPSKNFTILSDSCQNIDEKHNKTDGDEHLPLVKRARVRMGNLPEEKKMDDLVGSTDKSEKEAMVNHELNISHETFLNSRKPLNNSSTSVDHLQTKEDDTMPRKGNVHPLRGNTMDVEAALPPSKRLHRALEAMSANAAEASNDCLENLSSTHTLTTDNDFSKTDSGEILLDGNSRSPKESHEAMAKNTEEVSNSTSELPASFSLQIPKTSTECYPDAKHGGICHEKSIGLQSVDCKEKLMDVKDSKDLCNKTVKTELHDSHPSFVEIKEEKIFAASGHSALKPSPPSLVEESTKEFSQSDKESSLDVTRGEDSNPQVVKLGPGNACSQPIPESVDCVLKTSVVSSFLPENATSTTDSIMCGGSITSHLSGDMKSSSSLSDEKCGANTQEVTLGVKRKLTPKRMGFSPESTPMKVLIAAAQAKRFSRSSSLSENINCKFVPDGVSRLHFIHKEKSASKISPTSLVVNHTFALDEETSSLQSSSRSPDAIIQLKNSSHLIDADEVRLDSASTYKQKSLNRTVGYAEAAAARKSFEILLSSLTRTKESIGRASRLAIDCAKYGIAGEIVQMLLQILEKELSLSRRLDLFFLVDSITQCSRGQKGVAGDVYPSLVQSVLPRLLSAAAPPGNAAWDNRRQCLKVLRLWLERKTLPESIIRHHIRELESVNEASFSSGSSRRPPRTERPLNDPVREMEGMLVDEYGSNASFHIPGFLGSRLLDDEEESIDDEKSFETVTPEHDVKACIEAEATTICITEKHTHILEDVDGELEMEDVSPPREAEMSSPCDTAGISTEHASHCHFDKHVSLPFPPLPTENPPSPPPLPSSPPPVAPPCPPISSLVPPPLPRVSQGHADDLDSHSYMSRSNIQYPLSVHQPSTPSVNTPSDRVDSYAPGYVDHPKQMQLPCSSLKSSNSYGYLGGSHPLHGANDTAPLNNVPLHSKGYQMQPPPPATNQFSHSQSEKPHMQTWGDASPFDRKVAFTTEAQGKHLYGDRCARGPVQHEISERCRFSAAVHSGPMLPEKVEASTNLRAYYGPPSETSPVPSHGWTIPPRTSTYQYSLAASRPPLENQISRVAGARDYWRPR